MKKNNLPVQTEEKKLLKPKNDVVFQSIFNQNNERITKAFVEALLDEKITKMTINSDQILVRDAPEDKLGILDLVLTDAIEICILELDKVKNTYYKNKLDKKAQWMLFLDDPNSREVKEIMEKNNDIKDAVIEVHERSKDEQLRRIAELKEKAIMDEKAIYKAGRLRGEKEGKIQIIKNLHSMNLTVLQIAKAVEMSEADVQKIIDENA